MLAAAWIATSMIDFALSGFPPFLFRGCMSAGRVSMDGDFLIGPAIDEAAELYEQSDGPFFWLAPSALRIHDRYADTFNDRMDPNMITRYPVPMKNGTAVDTLTHTHFGLTRPPEGWALTRARIITAFGDTQGHPSVARKRDNVLALLDHIQQMAASPDRNRGFTLRLPYLEDLTHDQRMNILVHDGVEALKSFPRAPTDDSSR
jgi:hypothetical protein